MSDDSFVSFPWSLGVYDAHCHPTDIPAEIPSIPSMKTRVLTVMATRAQDQGLVASTADQYGLRGKDAEDWSDAERVVPSFGWHPWFAYQLFDDEELGSELSENADGSGSRGVLEGEAKLQHYQRVLQPSPAVSPPAEGLSQQDAAHHADMLQLPSPRSLSLFLEETRQYLRRFPLALVGEIGLDRSFHIPEWSGASAPLPDGAQGPTMTPGRREGRKLSPYRVRLQHQETVFKRQLQLAAEFQRPVSVHDVQAHGAIYDVLRELWTGCERRVASKRERKKRAPAADDALHSARDDGPPPFPPRVCLHSYSGSAAALHRYFDRAVPLDVYVSFSTAINLGDALADAGVPQAVADRIAAVPAHRLLVESDLHTAGDPLDRRVEDIVRRVCALRGWALGDGVARLGENWRRFVFG